MKIHASNYKALGKNTAKGFVDLTILNVGITIKGCVWHEKNESQWVSPPGKEYTTPSGEKRWVNVIEFSSREFKEEFQENALAAIRKLTNEDGGSDEWPGEPPLF